MDHEITSDEQSHVSEDADGSMTGVLLLFNVNRGGVKYTLKVERNFDMPGEKYQYEIARVRSRVLGPKGQKMLDSWTGDVYDEWTEAIGAGLEGIERITEKAQNTGPANESS